VLGNLERQLMSKTEKLFTVAGTAKNADGTIKDPKQGWMHRHQLG